MEGIVLTGGCGLNVLANQRIHDLASMWTLDVHVPPAPNDSGLSLGAVWSVSAPKVRQPLQYLGFPLWDEDKLARFAWTRGGSLFGIVVLFIEGEKKLRKHLVVVVEVS